MKQREPVCAGKRLLIFDFDGTLVNTSPLHAAAFTAVLAPMGTKVDYPRIAGMRTADAIERCLQGAGLAHPPALVAELTTAKQRLVRELIASELGPIEGVDEFLAWAAPRFRLALATSGSRGTVDLALRKLGYVRYFDPVVCSEDIAHSKPAPDSFLAVLTATGIPASEALVFEDSEAGFAAASASGIGCVDITTTSWPALLANEEDLA